MICQALQLVTEAIIMGIARAAPLEDVFCSRIRIRILKILMQLGQLNVSDIANRLSINYSATLTHLRILEQSGIVQFRLYGKIRLCRLNDSPQTKAMLQVIETWEN